ncbi:MAG: hypothetical protein VX777_08550 [Chlamydiota bacterium]|nr:hypothetical protein [Chlamydiota bacterium]
MVNMNASLSDTNKIIIEGQLQKLESKLNFVQANNQKSNTGFFSKVSSYISPLIPSAEGVGQEIGKRIGLTHGASVSNGMIDYVAAKIFQPTKPVGFFEGYSRTAVEKVAAEGVKLYVTPALVPIAAALGANIGGLTAIGTVALGRILYNSYFASNKSEYDIKNLPPIEEICKVNEKNQIVLFDGRILDKKDVEDIRTTVLRHQITAEIYNSSNVEDTIDKYLDACSIPDDNDKLKEFIEATETAYDVLSRDNTVRKGDKKIKKMIKILAENIPANALNEESGKDNENFGLVKNKDGIISANPNELKKMEEEINFNKAVSEFLFV